MIAKRLARGLEVVDLLREAVPATSTPSPVKRSAQARNPLPYARFDFSARMSFEWLIADSTSGQSSLDEPSTPR